MDYLRTLTEVASADLTFLNDEWAADMLRDGMRAVVIVQNTKETDVWTYLSTYEPPQSRGFMFSSDPIVDSVVRAMEVRHSGCSMAVTMRHLQLMAKIGFSAYRKGYLDNSVATI